MKCQELIDYMGVCGYKLYVDKYELYADAVKMNPGLSDTFLVPPGVVYQLMGRLTRCLVTAELRHTFEHCTLAHCEDVSTALLGRVSSVASSHEFTLSNGEVWLAVLWDPEYLRGIFDVHAWLKGLLTILPKYEMPDYRKIHEVINTWVDKRLSTRTPYVHGAPMYLCFVGEPQAEGDTTLVCRDLVDDITLAGILATRRSLSVKSTKEQLPYAPSFRLLHPQE